MKEFDAIIIGADRAGPSLAGRLTGHAAHPPRRSEPARRAGADMYLDSLCFWAYSSAPFRGFSSLIAHARLKS
jgi:hypothetical protein